MERLFQRFSSAYGKHWADMWRGADAETMQQIKADWGDELEGVNPLNMKEALDYCIAHNPFPPTLPEFKILCNQLHRPDVTKALPRHFSQDELDRNRQRLADATASLKPRKDYKLWAKRLIERAGNGDKTLREIALKFANEALRAEA